jgi:hypothetical protein
MATTMDGTTLLGIPTSDLIAVFLEQGYSVDQGPGDGGRHAHRAAVTNGRRSRARLAEPQCLAIVSQLIKNSRRSRQPDASSCFNREEHRSMPNPSTPIVALAKALPYLSRRLDQLICNGEDEPGQETKNFNLALGEWDLMKRQILEQTPRTLTDVAAQLMVAYDIAGDCHAACVGAAADHADRLMTVLARALRVVADATRVDLANFSGADFLDEEPDIFPEFAAST